MKKYEILVLVVGLLMILLVPAVSAFEFDNVGSYDDQTNSVTVENFFGLGDTISNLKLTSPLTVYVIPGKDRKVAEIEFEILNDEYENVFNEMEFYNVKDNMNQVDREFDYKIKTKIGTTQEPVYKEVCGKDVYEINSSGEYFTDNILCTQIVDHYETVDVYDWINLDKTQGLASGKYTIGIFTDVYDDDYIEWIPTLFGVKIDEWAFFQSSLYTDLVSVHSFDGDNITAALLNDFNGLYNWTNVGGNVISRANASCKNGRCIDSNNVASGQHLELTTNIMKELTKNQNNEFTASFWFYNPGTGCNNLKKVHLLGSGATSNLSNMFTVIHKCSANANAYKINIYGDTVNSDGPLLLGQNTWNHIVVTLRNSRVLVYANGTLDINATYNKLNTTYFEPNFLYDGANNDANERPSKFVRIDELYIWNRSLTDAEITDLYNNGVGKFVDKSSLAGFFDVYQEVPLNNTVTNDFNISFICNASSSKLSLDNLTINIHNSSNHLIYNQTTDISGSYNETNWSYNFSYGDTYLWNCFARDINNNRAFTNNFTLIIDDSYPEISITYPLNGSGYNNVTQLNWTLVEAAPSACWFNTSNDATENYLNCSDLNNSLPGAWINGWNTIYLYINDTANNMNYTLSTFYIDNVAPDLTIINPLNSTNYTGHYVDFNLSSDSNLSSCVISLDGFVNNFTLYSYNNTYFINSSSYLNDSNYLATAWCNDTFGNYNNTMTSNFSIVNYPNITITHPVTTEILTTPQLLEFTVEDTNLNSCWFNYNNTNTTVSCSSSIPVITNFTSETDVTSLTVYANDTSGLVSSLTRNWTWYIFVEDIQYNSSIYETGTYPYKLHLKTNGLTPLPSVNLYFNNSLIKSATYSGNITDMWFNTTYTIPTSFANTNTSIYWKINYLNSSYKTLTYNQTINNISLCYCGLGTCGTAPYLNISFIDEINNTQINATIPYSSFSSYYLGDGSVTKSYYFSNNTANREYLFCFRPSDSKITTSFDIQYNQDGYIQRRYSVFNTFLTNVTTKTQLYLLPSSYGSYTSFQVQDSLSNNLNDVLAQDYRDLNGDGIYETLVESGFTDSSGLVTFFLNADYTHQLVFSKTGYTTSTLTVRPTQSIYTVFLDTSSSSDANFDLNTLGMSWNFGPANSYLNNYRNHTFWFNISTNRENIVSCTFSLYDGCNTSKTLITTLTGCDTNGGNLSVGLIPNDVSSTGVICGALGVDIGNGTFYLDGALSWFTIVDYNESNGNLWTGLHGLSESDMFGEDNTRNTFSRIIFFYLFITIILGMFTFWTGWDVTNWSGAIFLFTLVVWMASFTGLLYIREAYSSFYLAKYGTAIILTIYSIGLLIRKFFGGER